MTKRMRAKLVLFFVPTMIVFLLVIPLIHFVKAGVGVVLRPPFAGTHRVVSYFDHQTPNYAGDSYIWIYNGERVTSSRVNHTGDPYPYDGHDGWDWSMNTGTDILAAAAGIVVVSTGNDNWAVEPCYGRTIVIDHGNSYYTQYSHLSQTLVQEGNQVTAGQHIAESGNTADTNCPVGGHLHFSVRHGGYNQDIYRYATDPFGWRGQQPDPLINHPAQGQGHTASCLWRSLDADPISCYDTIVEDAGRGSSIVGAWNVSTVGNGYRAYYRGVISGNRDIWASWLVTSAVPGINKVYAFIPAQNATTRHATYYIYDPSSGTWPSKTINQQVYTDEWALLGTYQVSPASAWVFLYVDTQEITSTLSIAADAIKFRSYPAYLPIVRLDPTPTVCVGC